MEDRVAGGLWLEAADAVDDSQPFTWWENACPNRTDLPRRMDEFRYLGISEVETDARWQFRRYPRPGQGVLTGKPTMGLLLVLVGVRDPDQAQAFRDWADFTHIHHIAASDDDWDRYESLHWRALEEWLAENPDDPEAPGIRERHERARDGYLALQRVDRSLLEPYLPPAIFYNLLISAS